jgi:pyruvate/2-oxoglutarate dehydrogenase complex dihydrolipoamide acyltransferase (E2) component
MNMRPVASLREAYQTLPFPKLRRALALMYPAVLRTHKVQSLIEVDVTDVRRYMRDHEMKIGEALSFTAFVVTCLARAVDENPSLNVCRNGGKHLALFDDVDVTLPIERDVEGRNQPIVYIVRGANSKGVRQITREIRTAQSAAVEATWEGFQAERWLMRLPIFALRGLWGAFWWVRGR